MGIYNSSDWLLSRSYSLLTYLYPHRTVGPLYGPIHSFTMFNLRDISLIAVFLATSSALPQGPPTSEQSEANITDPNIECQPYYYAPVSNALVDFPQVWTLATILSTDAAGQAAFASIANTIPDIPPKGQANENYDCVADPDCWWTCSGCTTPKHPGLQPDVVNVPEPNTLGYSFDDGPNCSHNAFHDFLQSQNQTATMFYIGSNVMDWPLQAQRAIADGHEICAHTWSHNAMTELTNEQAFAELWYSIQAITLVIGVTPLCWRPPYGDVDDRIRAIAAGLNLRTVLWGYDSNDWEEGEDGYTVADVDANYQLLINNETSGNFGTAGAIMLTHELNNFTMSEAIKWYPQLKAAFAHIVPISVALNITHPYPNSNYTLPSFQQYISGEITIPGDNNPDTSM
ncbi:carbohydrate esterase family 4 protein [Lactarius tabidus]